MSRYTLTIKRQVRVTEVSLTNILDEQIDVADDAFEPSNVIAAKCVQLMDLIGCTYEEAERLILARE